MVDEFKNGNKMKKKNQRHFCGAFMPNIYFLLQVIMTLLAVLVYFQVDKFLNFGTAGLYILFLVTAGSLAYFVALRIKIVKRQREHCHNEEFY